MSEQNSKIATVFDSDEQHVGEVYAKALIAAAEKDGQVDTVVDQLESLVVDVLNRNPKLDVVLSNPKMPLESKWELLEKVFGGSMNGTLLTFLKVIGRRNRFHALRAIQNCASRMRDEMAGRIQVEVTVPEAMDASRESALITKLASYFKKDVRLTTKIDPQIIGGLVVRVGDTVFDGSIDGQLRMLRKTVSARSEHALRSAADALVQAN